LIHESNGSGAPINGDGHAESGGYHNEMHAEGAMRPRTLLSVIVLAGLATTALVKSAPILQRQATTLFCSYRPISEPPTGSKISAAFFLANASEGERRRFLDSRAEQFRHNDQAIVDFVPACMRPDEVKTSQWLQEQVSARAYLYAEAIRHQGHRRVRLNVFFKDGGKSVPEPFDVDENFASPALDQYLAEVLLLRPYVKLADEWEQKLQNTIDNKIEYSADADRLAEDISRVADNTLLLGNCDAQLLSADAYLFARRPEEARKRMNSLVTMPACSQGSKYAAGLIYRLATVEAESARNTGSSSAQRAFHDDAYKILEKLWALPEELRKNFSGVAIAAMWKFRPQDGLTTATLRTLQDRSTEALKYPMKGKPDLYISLRQQQESISPLLSRTESEEIAAAEKIRADTEARQARDKEKEETAKAEGAAAARGTAERLAAEQKSRAAKRETDLVTQLAATKDELQATKVESAKAISAIEAQRDEALAELYRRIKADEKKASEEKNKAKPRASRSEPRPPAAQFEPKFECKMVITKNGRQIQRKPCPATMHAGAN
jgi:hypothetical protein